MQKIIDDLGIDETLTKGIKREKKITHVKDNIPLGEDLNNMADLLYLPETKAGFKYLLAVVDLATNEFDIEPIKNRSPTDILKAFHTIWKRKYVKQPYASIRTDGGSEFKGSFSKYLYDHSILHKVANPNRHQQLANVESLNKQLGRLFNGYMNSKEIQTGKVYKEWIDIIDIVREKLNAHRKVNPKDPFETEYAPPKTVVPKYKKGDLVYVQLDRPRNALGHEVGGQTFREGDFRFDINPKKVVRVLPYSGAVPVRYMVNGKPQVSYTEAQLRPAREKVEKFVVREILNDKMVNGEKYYLIWWKGYPKSKATWEPKRDLILDIPKLIKEYEEGYESVESEEENDDSDEDYID